MRSLVRLFDDLLLSMNPNVSIQWVHRLAQLFLVRLYTVEETEEIRGICEVTGIKMHLMVSLNVLLDLLMGCTSGGVRVAENEETDDLYDGEEKEDDEQNGQPRSKKIKMLHFRTLDWGMDALRALVVQLEYVRCPEVDKILATSITYVGFVGVLTGVRKNFSASLNFRPVHDTRKNFRFYFNHLLILLGVRRSISSLLRQYILPEPTGQPVRRLWHRSWPWRKADDSSHSETPTPRWKSLAEITTKLPSQPTTAAYLIFSDGKSTVTMEKDYKTAVVRSSSSFIVTTMIKNPKPR